MGLTKLCVVIAVCLSVCVQATDPITGWVGGTKCANICPDGPKVTCFNSSDIQCKSKKAAPGDYDYLVFAQQFLPQYCRDIEA